MSKSRVSRSGAVLCCRAGAQKRPLSTDDIYNLKDVRDPQRSPDGKWVAYVVGARRSRTPTRTTPTSGWRAGTAPRKSS